MGRATGARTSLRPCGQGYGMNSHPVDLIWNITRQCPWDCAVCCVDAVPMSRHTPQSQPGELSYGEKLSVLDNLAGFAPKIDISGGDPLAIPDALRLIEECSRRLGPTNVTVTATGATLARLEPDFAVRHVGELNLTYDMPEPPNTETRPRQYSNANLSAARRFLQAGLLLRAECPLTTRNIAAHDLERIYLDLHEAGVQTLLITRMFPVGRGRYCTAIVPSARQYRSALTHLRQLESLHSYPEVKLQCALRFFDSPKHLTNPCDLVRLSFGLMPDGTLLASPWAYGLFGRPLDDAWVLGNLAISPLSDILTSDKARYYAAHLDDNFGHCKVFSWLNSKRSASIERIFDTSDPLLTLRERTPNRCVHPDLEIATLRSAISGG